MHRDLKPENILFKNLELAQIIIADFGLATKTDVDKYMFTRCGTPGFVAPEIANLKD
jgi:calcium-dependent protein kinase